MKQKKKNAVQCSKNVSKKYTAKSGIFIQLLASDLRCAILRIEWTPFPPFLSYGFFNAFSKCFFFVCDYYEDFAHGHFSSTMFLMQILWLTHNRNRRIDKVSHLQMSKEEKIKREKYTLKLFWWTCRNSN